MEEKLKLSDYLLLCTKLDENPDDEGMNQIQDFLSKLVIREYIPLKEKELILMEILNLLNKDFDAPGVAGFIEIGKTVRVLLSYCINLEVDISYLTVGYFLVDAIHKYGLYSAILTRCKDDCNRLFNMVDNAINVSNIYRLLETASLFNSEEYDKWLESMSTLKDTLDSESLQNILSVMKVDAQTTGEDIVTQLKKAALESVQKDFKAEAEKFKNAAEAQEAPKTGDDLGENIN